MSGDRGHCRRSEESTLSTILNAIGGWRVSSGTCGNRLMNQGEIYAKTEEGVRELKERKRNLPVALRSLLIMVDGNRTVAEVLERARVLRVDITALATLERAGLIAKRFSAPSAAEAGAAPGAPSESEVERFLAAQQKLSDAINEHLGFRGYMMMMRLQRASNLRDLRDLLPDFAKAMVKRVGMDAATPIVGELEQLIVRG
jgi:hypothetical protein